MKPYKDRKLTETSKIRVFKSDVDSGELQWHRDREDRIVESIGETDGFTRLDLIKYRIFFLIISEVFPE